ncbi:hypothetical protein ACFWFX_27150 [Streptomyces roseolus]
MSEPQMFYAENGDASDEGVPEFHSVGDVLYLCHEDDHYCPDGAPEEAA